ncbi:uncharacterized protein LOC142224385 isoform X2 [Haematobia irritans]|uniref:uncharacterized protein LOC142224385 isoform X2 n=1 Tax=Haematobia irritans TaxID=7368 RepID=UPI003F5028CC
MALLRKFIFNYNQIISFSRRVRVENISGYYLNIFQFELDRWWVRLIKSYEDLMLNDVEEELDFCGPYSDKFEEACCTYQICKANIMNHTLLATHSSKTIKPNNNESKNSRMEAGPNKRQSSVKYYNVSAYATTKASRKTYMEYAEPNPHGPKTNCYQQSYGSQHILANTPENCQVGNNKKCTNQSRHVPFQTKDIAVSSSTILNQPDEKSNSSLNSFHNIYLSVNLGEKKVNRSSTKNCLHTYSNNKTNVFITFAQYTLLLEGALATKEFVIDTYEIIPKLKVIKDYKFKYKGQTNNSSQLRVATSASIHDDNF